MRQLGINVKAGCSECTRRPRIFPTLNRTNPVVPAPPDFGHSQIANWPIRSKQQQSHLPTTVKRPPEPTPHRQGDHDRDNPQNCLQQTARGLETLMHTPQRRKQYQSCLQYQREYRGIKHQRKRPAVDTILIGAILIRAVKLRTQEQQRKTEQDPIEPNSTAGHGSQHKTSGPGPAKQQQRAKCQKHDAVGYRQALVLYQKRPQKRSYGASRMCGGRF